MTTSVEKLNEALGVKSIDDVIDGLTLEDADEINNINNSISAEVKNNLIEIDNQIQEYKKSGDISLPQLDNNLNDVASLINTSKAIIQRVYENVASCELIDPEMVQAAAALITSTQNSILIYINLYRDKKRFYNSIAMEMLQQRNRLEILQKRHDYKMLEDGSSKKSEDDVENSIAYSQEAIVKAIQNMNL